MTTPSFAGKRFDERQCFKCGKWFHCKRCRDHHLKNSPHK